MSEEKPEDLTGYLDAMRQYSQSVDGERAREEMQARADELSGRLEGLEVASHTGFAGEDGDDERVSVVVDGRGGISSIEISPHAMKDFDAEGLAQACTEAIAAARRAAAEAMEELKAGIDTPQGVPMPPKALIDLAQRGGAADVFRQVREAGEQWTRRNSEL